VDKICQNTNCGKATDTLYKLKTTIPHFKKTVTLEICKECQLKVIKHKHKNTSISYKVLKPSFNGLLNGVDENLIGDINNERTDEEAGGSKA